MMKRRSQRLLTVALFCLPVQVAVAQTTLFYESFDAITPPLLPAAWDTTGTGWSTSASSSSSGSGLNNLAHTGASTAAIVTPRVDLSGYASGTLSYLARRTSSYPTDRLAVTASFDGGITYPVEILSLGAALPTLSSSWKSVSAPLPNILSGKSDVRFRFEARGGSTGGSNIRIDDLLVVAVADSSVPTEPADSTAGNTFGFQAVSSVALESSEDILIPLKLNLTAPDSLQGLQFSVTWDSSLLLFAGMARGAPISDSTSWTLSAEPSAGSLSVVLLGQGLDGLPPGAYGGFLSLGFHIEALPDASPDSVRVTVQEVIGSLAAPSGTDAGLTISHRTHTITIVPLEAYFAPSTTEMDLGTIPYDASITDSLSILNASATRALSVSTIESSNQVFSVDPEGFSLEPDSSRWVSITFSPSATVFGLQESTISFAHDGTNGSEAAIFVSATGTGGRGDLDSDGMVEILDLIKAIDNVLGRALLSARELVATDVFPFPFGDSMIDVRDLTVLVQGMVRGFWPDNVPLPVEVPPMNAPAEAFVDRDPSAHAGVRLALVSGRAARFDLVLKSDIPLRGVELILSGVEPDPARSAASDPGLTNGSPALYFNPEKKQLRVLLTQMDGRILPSGSTILASVLSALPSGEITIEYATGIDDALNRVPIEAFFTPTSLERENQTGDWRAGHPYPNPVLSGRHTEISIPISGRLPPEGLQVELFDILGRRMIESVPVTSTGMIRLPDKWTSIAMSPGLYFIRISGARRTESRAFSIVY